MDPRPRPMPPADPDAPPALPPAVLAAARSRVDAGARPGAVAMAFLEAVARARAGGSEGVFGVADPGLGDRPAASAGPLYAALVSGGHRRGHGVYYTPPGIARWMVEAALPEDSPGPRIVDPACGAGVFLLTAARRLEERARAAGAPDPKGRAARALFGVDRDPEALAVCRGILEAEGYAVPADHLVEGDALLGPWPTAAADAVVGNPPFVNIVRLEDRARAALKARYRTFRNKCDLYGLFVEAAAEHLAPGGRIALVLADSFLGTMSFAPLRRLLFGGEELRCRGVHRIDGRAFGAAVHPVVVVAEAGGEAGPVRFGTLDAAGRPGPATEIDGARLARRAARSAAVPKDPADLARTEAMATSGVPLGTLVDMSLGVKTGDDGRFVAGARGGVHRTPCVRGRTVGRYRVEGAGWLDYRPEVLRSVHGARPRKPETFARPLKVLLRETAGARLVAAMDRAGQVPLDTVHALHAPASPRCSMWYVLAVLDAAPTGFWYGQHHPGPHVKLGEVRALPVPAPFPVPPDPVAVADAVSAAACFLAAGDPGAAVPEACLAPAARHALLDVLARWRTDPKGPAARVTTCDALVDAVVARGYGLATWPT